MSKTAWNKIMTDIDEQNIVRLYTEGHSAPQILKIIKKFKTKKTIYDVLKKYNIPTKEKWEYSRINHNAFNRIETEAQAYFLGLLYADGWVQKKSNEIGIQLIHTDIGILKKLALFLNIDVDRIKVYIQKNSIYNGKILNRSPVARLVWYSPWMKKCLSQYGIINRKSTKEWLPYLPEQSMRHFLRGFLDGDGTICRTKIGTTHIKFIGSKTICEQIRQFLHYKLNIKLPKISQTTPTKMLYGVTWAVQKDVENLIYYFWNNATYYLKRKYPYEN